MEPIPLFNSVLEQGIMPVLKLQKSLTLLQVVPNNILLKVPPLLFIIFNNKMIVK